MNKKQAAARKAAEIVGGCAELARQVSAKGKRFRISRQGVDKWMRNGVPLKWCKVVAEVTGGEMSPQDFQPELAKMFLTDER